MSAIATPPRGPILGLCGSLRPDSFTRRALERVLDVAAGTGIPTRLLAGDAMRLPLCDGRDGSELTAEVEHLRDAVRDASALVFASPEYCGTFSAVIKNAIEWIGPEILEGTVAGVVTVAAGGSSDSSLTALRELLLREGVWVVPIPASVPMVAEVFGEPDVAFSRSVLGNLDALGQHLPRAAARLAADEYAP